MLLCLPFVILNNNSTHKLFNEQGQETLVQHLRKSYSMNDLAEDHSGSSQHFSSAASATNGLIGIPANNFKFKFYFINL